MRLYSHVIGKGSLLDIPLPLLLRPLRFLPTPPCPNHCKLKHENDKLDHGHVVMADVVPCQYFLRKMKMNSSLGVNLRVTGHCNQGDRKYMEDMFCVAYQQTEDGEDLEYAYFGIFDGHGGKEAAVFARERLMEFIVNEKKFWSDDDEDVLSAIKSGYLATHHAMWKELG